MITKYILKDIVTRQPRAGYLNKIQLNTKVYTKEQYENAFTLRKKGLTYKEIAKELNVPYPKTVADWIDEGKIPRGRFLNNNFSKVTPELAYILGVVEGDGYLRLKRTKGLVGLEVKDRDFALAFKNSLEKWSGIKVSFYLNKKKGLYFVGLYSLRAVLFLKNVDLDKLKNENTGIRAKFLRGVFDAEGSVAGSNLTTPKVAARFISVYNKDRRLIRLIKVLLKSVGIKIQKIRKVRGSGFSKTGIYYILTIGGRENLQRFKELIGFNIERKNKKLEEALKSYKHYF